MVHFLNKSVAGAKICSAMEAETIQKNAVSLKNQMSKRNRTIMYVLGLYISLFLVTSCGGGSTGGGSTSSVLPTDKVDYMMLHNDVELKKVYDAITEKLGENIHYVDEINIAIQRPSTEGVVIRPGKPDGFTIRLSYLYPQDKNKLYQQRYSNESKWSDGEVKGIKLIGGDKESFRLQDAMFDMSPLTAETLSKVVNDAMEKYKDAEKYAYQYAKNIDIKDGIVKIQIYGRLSANDLEKSNYYFADLKGVEKKK